jgi:hypothetical protein
MTYRFKVQRSVFKIPRRAGKVLASLQQEGLDAAYNGEVKVLETKLQMNDEGFQSILDEVSRVDPRAKKIKTQDLVDRRFLDEMEKSGFFDKLWGKNYFQP